MGYLAKLRMAFHPEEAFAPQSLSTENRYLHPVLLINEVIDCPPEQYSTSCSLAAESFSNQDSFIKGNFNNAVFPISGLNDFKDLGPSILRGLINGPSPL